MKFSYDFHIHTALSPCGDNEMTPNNIVNMALIKELAMIAITDHNICGNVKSVMEVAVGTPLIVIPGMEIETAEEAHMLCLFPDLETALAVESIVHERLPKIKNKEDVFGQQLFLDAEDEITGSFEYLLLSATDIGIYELVELVNKSGGIAIPAHVDRKSYSVLANLGFVPEDLDTRIVEISNKIDAQDYFYSNRRLFPKAKFYLQSSDAHYLPHINEPINFLDLDTEPSPQSVIAYLKNRSTNKD